MQNEVLWKQNVISMQEENNVNLFAPHNKVFISGIIEKDFEFSHEFLFELFYKTRIKTNRLSDAEDYVPIVVSELLINNVKEKGQAEGKYAEVTGEFRSHNKRDQEGKSHLELFLYVSSINIYDSMDEMKENMNLNSIYLEGYVCKNPAYRVTYSKKEVTDIIIAVRRQHSKSDYIPCIAWGRTAMWTSYLKVGDKVKLYGRIQSRKYLKRTGPDSSEQEIREAYELSIMRICKID